MLEFTFYIETKISDNEYKTDEILSTFDLSKILKENFPNSKIVKCIDWDII